MGKGKELGKGTRVDEGDRAVSCWPHHNCRDWEMERRQQDVRGVGCPTVTKMGGGYLRGDCSHRDDLTVFGISPG